MSSDEDQGVIECVSINGVIINLSDVSPGLQHEYHSASRAVGRHDKAKSQLAAVGEKILAEQMPHLAVKHAPAVRGDRAVMARLAKRAQ